MQIITIEQAEIMERAERLKSILIVPENAKKLESLRTETGDYLKSIKTQLKEAKDKYLEPFAVQEAQVLATIKPLEDALKRFSDEILDSKKIAFRNKVCQEWEYLVQSDIDGNIAPFDEIYDPAWYGKAEKVWKPLLIKAWKTYIRKGDKANFYFVLENCEREKAEAVERFIIENKINYRKEEI